MLKENYEKVRSRIDNACERTGRNPEDVTLIAVSKTKPLSDIEEILRDTNAIDFGENKVQELVDKYENVSRNVNWHMIGHLQTNKVKYIVDKVCMIHSVDSLNLAKTIEKEAAKLAGEIKRASGMLANPKFVDKAPAAKVEEEKAKLAKYTEMSEQVAERLAQLKK